MERNLTYEGEISRQRVHKVLERFATGEFQLVDFHPENETRVTLHTPTHLFTVLKNCQQHCNHEGSLQILHFLIKTQQCSKNFSWKMFLNFLQGDPELSLLLLPKVTQLFEKFQIMHKDEIHLVKTIHLLNKRMYQEAQLEAAKFGKIFSNETYDTSTKFASSALLISYYIILELLNIQPDDETPPDLKEYFHHTVSENAFLPLLVEPYTFCLKRLNFQEEAAAFLKKYVDMESDGNIGIGAALHALNVMKLHLPKASVKHTVSLLEMIAGRCPGTPKVLELCHHYLHIHSTLMQPQSDLACTSDIKTDGSTASLSHDSLDKCLRSIFDFLDVHIFNLPSAVTREAWTVMADTIRRICLQRAEKCLQSIVELWHNDRKRWWPVFRLPRSGLPPTLPPDDAELFTNKGFVCYILESHRHPFVAGLLVHEEIYLLKSLVTQMNHSKTKFDMDIEHILRTNVPVSHVPLISPPVLLVRAPSNQSIRFTSRCEFIDTEQQSREVAKYLLTTKPFKPKEEYKSAAKIHSSTFELLKLPIHELVAKRYENRRKIRAQSKGRRTASSSSSASTMGCSNSSSFQLDLSKRNSKGSKVETLEVDLSNTAISEPSKSEDYRSCNRKAQSEDQQCTRASCINETIMPPGNTSAKINGKSRTASSKDSKAKTSVAKISKAESLVGDNEIKNLGAVNKLPSTAKNSRSARKPLVNGKEYLNIVEELAKEVVHVLSVSTQHPAEKLDEQCSKVQQRKSTRHFQQKQ